MHGNEAQRNESSSSQISTASTAAIALIHCAQASTTFKVQVQVSITDYSLISLQLTLVAPCQGPPEHEVSSLSLF